MADGELGRTYEDNEILFREGDKGESMYVIQSGSVAIERQTPNGMVHIATLGPGDIFGEMALFDRMPRSATAKAKGSARVLSVDKKKLFSTISHDPTLVFKIIETMSRRIRRLNEHLGEMGRQKAETIKTHFDIDETCRMALEEAREVVKADNGSVMLIEGDGMLSIRAAFGGESTKKLHLSVGEGIAGDVLKSGRAELINNVKLDPRFKPGSVQITSMLCVPLKYEGATLGVMNMSMTSDRLFTIDDLKLLHSLCAYAAIAVQNAKNFATLTDALDRALVHATILDV